MAGVRITGLRETIRNLERLGVGVADLKEAMSNVSQKVVADAQSRTPVRTGRLRQSIRANKAKAKAVVKAGNARTPYASFIEYGTSKISAVNFMKDAVVGAESYAAQQIETEVRSLIKRYNLN